MHVRFSGAEALGLDGSEGKGFKLAALAAWFLAIAVIFTRWRDADYISSFGNMFGVLVWLTGSFSMARIVRR